MDLLITIAIEVVTDVAVLLTFGVMFFFIAEKM